MSGTDDLKEAIGRRTETREVLAAAPARRLAATFDRCATVPEEGDALPPGWHWLYFLDAPPTRRLGEDGRTVAGGFLPETGLPRRMWAGGRFQFHGALHLGREAVCTTTIVDARRKQGRSGALAFITTKHAVAQDGIACVEERRDLVFREAPRPGETGRREAVPEGAAWRHPVQPDAVLLFRFSALTFNAHRIHYDADYCREIEGYPDLVVHGPMLALLLLEALLRELPERTLRSFEYRAVAPVFAHRPLYLCGRPADGGADLWIEADDGRLATVATAQLE